MSHSMTAAKKRITCGMPAPRALISDENWQAIQEIREEEKRTAEKDRPHQWKSIQKTSSR